MYLNSIIPKYPRTSYEDMYTVYSFAYSSLDSYFYLFNVLKDSVWLSWQEIIDIPDTFKLRTLRVLFKGTFKKVSDLQNYLLELLDTASTFSFYKEGLVIRHFSRINTDDFKFHVPKIVGIYFSLKDLDWSKWQKASLLNHLYIFRINYEQRLDKYTL